MRHGPQAKQGEGGRHRTMVRWRKGVGRGSLGGCGVWTMAAERAAERRFRGGPADGDRLPHVPRWAVSASIIKEIGLGDLGTLIPRLDWTYRSKVYFNPDNAVREIQAGHSLFNANIAWNSADEKYALTFFVNNISDKRYVHFNETSRSAGTGSELLARDREWYLTGEVRF